MTLNVGTKRGGKGLFCRPAIRAGKAGPQQETDSSYLG